MIVPNKLYILYFLVNCFECTFEAGGMFRNKYWFWEFMFFH